MRGRRPSAGRLAQPLVEDYSGWTTTFRRRAATGLGGSARGLVQVRPILFVSLRSVQLMQAHELTTAEGRRIPTSRADTVSACIQGAP